MIKFDTVCIRVKDMERAYKFYSDIGLKPLDKHNEGNDIEKLFELPCGIRIGIVEYKFHGEDIYGKNEPPAKEGFSGFTMTCIVESKDEIEQYAKVVKDSGGTILRGPTDLDWGAYLLYFADPDGYVWELLYIYPK